MLIRTIIETELDDNQKEQFAIEGDDLIKSLLISNNTQVINSQHTFKLDYGLSNEALKIVIEGTTSFISIIVSFVSLYLQYNNKNSSVLKNQLEKIELERQLNERLKTENISEEMANILTNKYHSDLYNIIKKL